jgi:hypothetical protein
LVYEPEALTTLSPGMAGTVKLCVPEPPGFADFVGFADFDGVTDFVGIADRVGRADLVAMGEALCVAAAEVAGVTEGPDSVESPDGEDGADKAVAEPPAAADDAAVGEFPPSPAHAVRPVPAITTPMITAGTRHIRMMLLPFGSNQMLQIVKLVIWATR